LSAFLEVRDLVKDFDGLKAVAGLDLTLEEGELLAVIGPNGCGKSTFFNLITGALAPSSGQVRFAGQDIAGRPAFRIARLGIGRKFQVPGVFASLSVRENLVLPILPEGGSWGLLGRGAPRAGAGEVATLLALAGLSEKADWLAAALSHGEKQWLEIAMVVAGRPRLMLLDEPTAGMTLTETEETVALIKRISAESGIAILVIEHDMNFVRALGCDVAVMMRGQILCRGSYAEVSRHPEVRRAYLGEEAVPC
jgi:urea ABC transporter ATP-binding protein UrtD